MANLKNTIIFFGLIELISYFSAIISVFLPFMVLDAAVIKEDNYNGDVKLVIDIVREVMFDPRYQNVRYVPRSYIRFTTGVCVLIFVIISVLFAGINTFTKIIAENSKNDKSNGKTNVNIIDIIPLIFTIISIILTIISGLSIFDEYILMSIGFISLLIALIVAFVDRIAYIIVIKKHSNNVMKSFENPGQQNIIYSVIVEKPKNQNYEVHHIAHTNGRKAWDGLKQLIESFSSESDSKFNIFEENHYDGDRELVSKIYHEASHDPKYMDESHPMITKSYNKFSSGICVLIFVLFSVIIVGVNTFAKNAVENFKNENKSNAKTIETIIDLVPFVFTFFSFLLTLITAFSIFDKFIKVNVGFVFLLIALIVALAVRGIYLFMIKDYLKYIKKPTTETPEQQV